MIHSDDGRVGEVSCSRCGAVPKAAMDIVDETLYLWCPECEDTVLHADVLGGEVNISTKAETVDDLDPAIREPIKAALDAHAGGDE